MAVENTPRRAGPFVSDGNSTVYAFGFRVFKADEVGVSISSSTDEDAADIVLTYEDDYVVELNPDQEHNPGGVVVLLSAPPGGIRVTLDSRVPATQETVLTNHDGFSPTILNDVHDKLTILVQQLKDTTDRVLVLPKTSQKTPAQVLQEIINIAASANEFAQLAAKTYQETLATKALVDQTRIHVDQQKALVDASEAEVEEDRLEVEQMLADAQKVNEVTEQFLPHLDDLVEVGSSIEDVQAVASELQGFPIESMDLGFITDEASPVYESAQSNIALLGENIELLRTVVENIEQIQTAVSAAERAEAAATAAEDSASDAEASADRLAEVEKTDYEQIYEEGV